MFTMYLKSVFLMSIILGIFICIFILCNFTTHIYMFISFKILYISLNCNAGRCDQYNVRIVLIFRLFNVFKCMMCSKIVFISMTFTLHYSWTLCDTMHSFLRTADIDTDHYEENCDVHILPADKHLKYIFFVRYEYLICESFYIHNFVFVEYQKFKQLFNSPFWYNCINMLDIWEKKIQLVTFQAFYMYYGKYTCMMYNQLVYNLHAYNNITFLSLWRDQFSSQSSQLQKQFFSNVFPCKMSPILIFSWFLLWLTPVWNFTKLLCILWQYDLGCEIKLYDMMYQSLIQSYRCLPPISHTELSVLAALNLCKRLNFTRFL